MRRIIITIVLISLIVGLGAYCIWAASKTWTASDIRCGKIMFIRHTSAETGQDVLTIYRDYYFVNATGENIGALVPQRLVRNIPWESLPEELKNVYTKLDTWTRSEALKDQGME